MTKLARSLLSIVLSGALLIGLSGCDRDSGITDPGDDDDAEVTFSQIQEEIFDVSCALSGCHGGGSQPGSLGLDEGESYDNLVGVEAVIASEPLLRVEPGNPDDSFLVIKLEGGPRLSGSRMPLGRAPLSTEQIEMVRAWILAGAPNN